MNTSLLSLVCKWEGKGRGPGDDYDGGQSSKTDDRARATVANDDGLVNTYPTWTDWNERANIEHLLGTKSVTKCRHRRRCFVWLAITGACGTTTKIKMINAWEYVQLVLRSRLIRSYNKIQWKISHSHQICVCSFEWQLANCDRRHRRSRRRRRRHQ